jgi:hypothetical protein
LQVLYPDVLYFFGSSDSASSTVRYGGGSSAYYAVTQQLFYTHETVNHTLGTVRMNIDKTGNVYIGYGTTELGLNLAGECEEIFS